jgi:hypothetical protein
LVTALLLLWGIAFVWLLIRWKMSSEVNLISNEVRRILSAPPEG